MESDRLLLGSIESNRNFDFRHFNNIFHSAEPSENPYTEIDLSSNYHDHSSIINTFQNSNQSLLMSLNIQSLQSKYQKLINLLNHFSSKGVNIDVIALHEVWQIPFPDLLQIPGYNLFFKTRKKNKRWRGGFL